MNQLKQLTLLILLTLLLLITPLHAQTGRYFNGDNQLSTSMVTHTFQDDKGKIWIATNNGLNTFDGYQFRIYNKGQVGLASNIINGFAQTPDGTLYIALDNALQYVSRGRFLPVTLDNGEAIHGYFRHIYKTSKGELITGASARIGLLQITGQGRARWIHEHNPLIDSPLRIAEDRRGALWMVTESKGLVILYKGHTTQHFGQAEFSSSMKDICIDRRQTAYVACQNGGVYWAKTDAPKPTFALLPGTEHLPVVSLLIRRNGHLLLGTDGQGLFEYDPAHRSLRRVSIFSTEVNMDKVKIMGINEDHEGNIWISMLQKGLFMQPAIKPAFHYQGYRLMASNMLGEASVGSVRQSSNHHIWVALDGDGLYELAPDGTRLRHYTPPTVPSAIMDIEEDLQHRIWIASYLNGCGWIDAATGTYHRLPCTYGKAQSVFDIVQDRRGFMWVGTLGDGLKRVNLSTNEVREFRELPQRRDQLVNNYIYQLNLSPDGQRLYVSTSVGLSCLDLRTYDWVSTFGSNVILRDHPVNDAKEDSRGRIWICTNNGLYIYNIRTRQTDSLTTQQGLADDNTAAVQFDRQGKAWVSTLHGLSCIDMRTMKIENYYLGDGLQGNEFSWGVGDKSVIGGRETLFFGGVSGLTWFDPSAVPHQTTLPRIFITSLTVGGDEVKPGDESGVYTITDDEIDVSKTFNLSHQDNSFAISLSTLSYINTEKTRYAYCIDGDQWILLPQGKNTITLAHMQPGSYTFRVKAIVGTKESEVKQFQIVIHPAWYFSIWAKMLYVILLALAVWWYIHQMRRKQQSQLRLQEQIHAQDITESKLRFFMNISHEIRTPLTLIISPLEELMKTDLEPIRSGIYHTIHRNAMRLMSQLNQMMDLRKIDAGKMVMNLEHTDLISFSQDIAMLFEQQAKVKSISFHFVHSQDTVPVNIDRHNFDKVLMNILSNAFKYTHTGGNITMTIAETEVTDELTGTPLVSIEVSDDGEKIPEDKLEKIFERFYQASSAINNRQAGTGIGLDLTRSLVEMHGGTITAHNNADRGCTFTVCLPTAAGHTLPEKDSTQAAEPASDLMIHTADTDKAEEVEIIRSKAVTNPLIVIAEDDTEIRQYLSQELEKNFRIIACSDGKTALTAILKYQPQLIISDVMMPEMDGNELCTKVRHNVNTNDIPIILLTAKDRDDDRLVGLETGADAYITKPFNMDILKRTMINLINMRNVMKNKILGGEEQNDKIDEVKVDSPDDKLLQRVMAVINDNLTNEELSVKLISQEVGISRVHLYRKMKELTNQTPHDLIRNIRLKQAAKLLSNGRHNITEVMTACGFTNLASFSTQFKKMYGMSPREYMKEKM